MLLRSFAPVMMVAAFAGLMFGSPARAQEYSDRSPTQQYVAIRRLYSPVHGLTAALLEQNPRQFEGLTFEIEGNLSAIMGNRDGRVQLLVDSPAFNTPDLTMDRIPDWLQAGSDVRVLVVVLPVPPGEVRIGMPPLAVVAIASASDIAVVEAEEQTATSRRDRERQNAALQRAAMRLTATAPNAANRNMALRPNVTTRLRGGANDLLLGMSPLARTIFPRYKAFVLKWNPRLPDTQADAIAASVLLFSEKYDVDPRLVVSLIIAESDFRPKTTSNKGAMGLGQLMPDEVRTLGLTNPYDPVQNIAGAVYLLRGRLDKYSGGAASSDLQMRHIILALASYNAGMGAVKKYKGVPPYRETQNYVKKIERIYRDLCQGDGQNNAAFGGAGGGGSSR